MTGCLLSAARRIGRARMCVLRSLSRRADCARTPCLFARLRHAMRVERHTRSTHVARWVRMGGSHECRSRRAGRTRWDASVLGVWRLSWRSTRIPAASGVDGARGVAWAWRRTMRGEACALGRGRAAGRRGVGREVRVLHTKAGGARGEARGNAREVRRKERRDGRREARLEARGRGARADASRRGGAPMQ